MKKTITFKEKIAMIWTFPMIFIAVIGFAALTFVLYFSIFLMNVTGTTGAALFIFDKIKLKLADMKFKKLIKKDEKRYKFDSLKLKKDEDSSEAID